MLESAEGERAYLVDVVHEAVDHFALARLEDDRLELHVEEHVARRVHDDAVADRLEAAWARVGAVRT